MTRFLPKLYLDLSSFWAGILLVIVLLVLYLRFRKRVNAFLTRAFRKIIDFRESLSISSDSDYIQVLFKYSQGLHLTADYFPLDSILMPPQCIAPPPVNFPGKIIVDTSLVQQSIGYHPLLPELTAEFFGPKFPLSDAVRNGTNLCLVGLPGCGKTTAIADCMADLARNRNREGETYRRIPFYIKAHHLLSQFPDSNIIGVLLKAIQSNKAFLAIPNFPKYLTGTINSGHAVIFIDDIDLLTYADINRVANFIKTLLKSIPELQVVATCSPTCLGPIITVNLEFLSIASWGDREKYAFLNNLAQSWSKTQSHTEYQLPENRDIQNKMMVVSDHFSTPLEFTLKALALYAGDITGPGAVQAIKSYLNREFNGQEDILEALEIIALYSLQSRKSSFSRRDLNAWVVDIYNRHTAEINSQKIPTFSTIIQVGIDHKVLESASSDEYTMSNPTIAGYLAAKGLAKFNKSIILEILESPDWSLMHETMRFFPLFNDIKPYLKPLLDDQSILRNKLLRASHWLPGTDNNSPEHLALLKALTRDLNTNDIYLIKLCHVCSLSRSENPTVKSIFQHLLGSDDLNTRRAAAIGCGLIRDLSSVPLLITQLNDAFPANTASCYALGRIGSPRSLEAVAEALLHGTELLRRAAAEALAHNRSEGHPALREGVTREDLLVRYAVVHGLSLIPEDWSLNILDKMRIDEKEWVVRDLAQQTYEIIQNGSPYLPQPVPPPQKAPWLRKFASDKGLPDPSDENALEYLLMALEIGTDEQKQNSLAHLSRSGKDELIPNLLKAAEVNRSDISSQAELAIWYLAPPRYHFLR